MKAEISMTAKILAKTHPRKCIALLKSAIPDPLIRQTAMRHAAAELADSAPSVLSEVLIEIEDMRDVSGIISGAFSCALDKGDFHYAEAVFSALPSGELQRRSAQQIAVAVARNDINMLPEFLAKIPASVRDQAVLKASATMLAGNASHPSEGLQALEYVGNRQTAVIAASSAGSDLGRKDIGMAVQHILTVSDTVLRRTALDAAIAAASTSDLQLENLRALAAVNPEVREALAARRSGDTDYSPR